MKRIYLKQCLKSYVEYDIVFTKELEFYASISRQRNKFYVENYCLGALINYIREELEEEYCLVQNLPYKKDMRK